MGDGLVNRYFTFSYKSSFIIKLCSRAMERRGGPRRFTLS